MDIATDVSHFAERTLLSVRRGSWVIPKRMLGKPADQVIRPWVATHVPWRLRQPIAQTLLKLTVGKPEDVGLPAPDGGLFQSHPTISDTIVSRISHGEITPKPGIEALEPTGVRFTDGTREDVDAIVWCTGYRVTIPFLEPEVLGGDPQTLPLYKRILHLEHPDLFFVGLMQSTGSAFPILERQSQLLAEHLTGRWAPPSPADMRADCDLRYRKAHARWGDHGRPDDARRLRRLHARAARSRSTKDASGDEHAIVTGAGGAFGSAIVARLRASGWQVVGLDLVADEVNDVLACDVTSDESVAAAVPAAIAQLGGLDALVNNAGIGGPASAGEAPDAHVLKMIDVNLLGGWRVTAAAIEALVESRGQVVFVGSRMSFLGLPLGAAYGVSKRGVTAYADALRAEYGTHVGVTCVHPAFVRTPIHDRTREAGLQLEGFSREEPLEGVVDKIVAGCEGDRRTRRRRHPRRRARSSRSPGTCPGSSTASWRARCASASPPASSTARRSRRRCASATAADGRAVASNP